MKKITGKVVSLVLALALVVTSFSSSFAFASTTKTMSGQVATTHKDKIYLVNGGVSKEVNLTKYLIDNNSEFALATKDRSDVTSPKIDAISHVSGDKLVSLYISTDSATKDDAILKLKNGTNNSGHEVISILYEGSYTNDNGDEYTVKAKKNFDVYVYDKDAIVYGEAKSAVDLAKDSGEGLDDFETFAQTGGSGKTLGIYKAEPYDNGTDHSALATFSIPALTTLTSGIKDSNAYSYELSSGSGLTVDGPKADLAPTATPLKATVGTLTHVEATGTKAAYDYYKDAGTGNVTITIKKLIADGTTFKASSDSKKKYVLKTKIEKKVDAGVAFPSAKAFTVSKDAGNTLLNNNLKVTDCEIVFPAGTTEVTVDKDTHVKKISGYVGKLSIGDANVGSVKTKSGDVYVSDGKVGDITTDDKADYVTSGTVTVNSGKTGNIKTTDADGTNGDNGNVTVTGGTTGTIESKGLVSVTSNEDDTAIVIGKITAPKALAYSDAGKITIAGFTANDKGGYLTLKGDNTNVGPIDFDYYSDTALNLGLDDDTFVGKVAAPLNASNTKISVNTDDTAATVNGAVTADTISVDTDATVAFDSTVTVATIDGDGSMKIAAGKLYVSDSASGVKLKLTDANLAVGTVVFKAKTDTVDEDSLTTYGYTLSKSTGTSVDTFKIATLSFAGVAINKASSNIAKNYSETFTASAYPGGTAIPAGDTIKWDLDGGSSDVFTLTSTGNTATVKVNSIDSTFASENKTTLTATLYDADGYVIDDFDAAKCELTATAVPDAKSDTNSATSVAKGASYQMKVTSATTPVVTVGTKNVFSVVLASKNGNDYFYKLTATGAVNASTGVFLNGTKIFVATVKAFAFTCDTTKATTVKGAYQFKITSATTPTVSVGSAAFKLAFVSKTGNAYFYKITSAGKAGTQAGIYVNGAKAFVATVG